ncbi:MAG TPA: acyl-CoA dehydrogenase [Symbiobacteriaceae bacterium]|nr:acyl-CoA dehydrogenase [Symbiobacteriaceae bacterium]
MQTARTEESHATALPQFAAAEAFDLAMGHPLEGARPLSFQQVMALDEGETYPRAPLSFLKEWGFQQYHIPVAHGGKLAAYDEFMMLVRLLAGRDLSTAVAANITLLGGVTTWVAGTAEQKERVAQWIAQGKHISFGLTEQNHGSDLVANRLCAEKVDGGWLLTGEKWPIGDATQSSAMTVYARTDERGGPRGFSLFLVDKETIDPQTWRPLPKIPTLGMRASDVSGIAFDRCFVPDSALIGPLGAGIELALKGLQLSRTMCGGLAMGAGDTALRVVTDFALTRRLYGSPVLAIPHVQSTLAEAFADLLIAECVTITGARALHVVPDQLSVWSAIVKYLVPVTVEETIRRLSVVLGARYFLRDTHWEGIFQKTYRDSGIVSVFEGSTVVQLHALAVQLRQLLSGRKAPVDATPIFDLSAPLPGLQLSRLDLTAHGHDSAIASLGHLEEALAALNGDPSVEPACLQDLLAHARALQAELGALKQDVDACANPGERSAEAFDLARRFALIHAGAAALALWLHSRRNLDAFMAGGQWLALGLQRVLAQLRPSAVRRTSPWVKPVLDALVSLHEHDRLFSVTPVQLAAKPVS